MYVSIYKSAQTGNTLQLLQKKRKRNHIPMLYPGINSKFPGKLMIKAIAMIRKLDKTEYDRATSLALEVYIQCGAEDFDEEGLNSFKSFIFSEQLMNELVIYGAFDNERRMLGSIYPCYSSEKNTTVKASANNYSILQSSIAR